MSTQFNGGTLMQQSAQIVMLSGMIQMCGNSSSNQGNDYSDGLFPCSDYQLMIDVELEVGRECSTDTECDQIIFEGDLECESNSLLVNSTYQEEHFTTLYEEALAQGCIINLPLNEDCSATQPQCEQGTCVWQ